MTRLPSPILGIRLSGSGTAAVADPLEASRLTLDCISDRKCYIAGGRYDASGRTPRRWQDAHFGLVIGHCLPPPARSPSPASGATRERAQTVSPARPSPDRIERCQRARSTATTFTDVAGQLLPEALERLVRTACMMRTLASSSSAWAACCIERGGASRRPKMVLRH